MASTARCVGIVLQLCICQKAEGSACRTRGRIKMIPAVSTVHKTPPVMSICTDHFQICDSCLIQKGLRYRIIGIAVSTLCSEAGISGFHPVAFLGVIYIAHIGAYPGVDRSRFLGLIHRSVCDLCEGLLCHRIHLSRHLRIACRRNLLCYRPALCFLYP